jgi:hypothetical protein
MNDAALVAAALGLRLSVKAYPFGSPVRDAAQLRLIDRFRTRVGHQFEWRVEVPVSRDGDLRAWDIVLGGSPSVAVDAETRVHDIQAVQRRIELKLRDSGLERMVLLVAGTHHNRRVIREHRATLRTTLPLDTAETMASLRSGRAPPSNGIVLL